MWVGKDVGVENGIFWVGDDVGVWKRVMWVGEDVAGAYLGRSYCISVSVISVCFAHRSKQQVCLSACCIQ